MQSKTLPQDLIMDLATELEALSPTNGLRLGRIGHKLLELKHTLLKQGEVHASACVEDIQGILGQIVDGRSRDALADVTRMRQAVDVLKNVCSRNEDPVAQKRIPKRQVGT